MGNKPVTLGVETNASSYESGSILSGQAYMEVTKEGNIRHDIHATSLNLQLMGEEAAMVIEHEVGVDRDSHVFWSLNVPLTHFKSGLVPPGRFQYPFQIWLPSNLPGSMYFQEGESGCEIRYTLFVHLVGNKPDIFDSTGGDTGSTVAKTIFITPKQIMPTSTKYHDEISRSMIPAQVFPIRRCCCVEGSMAIGGRVDRTLLTPNEVLSLDVSILNNSMVSVKAVHIDLNETIEFRTKGHQRRVCRKIAQKRFIGDLFPGVEPLEKVRSKWGSMGYSLVRGTEDGHIETEAWLCGSPELQRNITLRIPRGVRSTYTSGKMITIQHSLTVCLDLGNSFTTIPEISFLLQIIQPISSNNDHMDEIIMEGPAPKRTFTQSPPQLVSLPEDWNVTVTTADIVLVDEELVSRSTLDIPPTVYSIL